MQIPKISDDQIFSDYLESLYLISHSANTVNSYKSGLAHFKSFAQENFQCTVSEIVESINQGKVDVYKILGQYVIYLDKQKRKPKSIKLWVGSVKGCLRHCGIKIYSEDCRQSFRLPKIIRYREEPLTKEIIVRLLRNTPIKLQTAILVAIASGMRVGELVQLRISDIDFNSKPTKIRIRAETTKTKEARETYLTVEATNALKDYLGRFFDWSEGQVKESIQDQAIFGRTTMPKKKSDEQRVRKKESDLRCTPAFVAESVLVNSLKKHIKKIPELNKLNENGRRQVHFHAFRKFFRTIVGDAVGRDYAEAIMGHHFYLDTYYNLPDEKKREMYLKAEPYLTISDYTRIEKNLKSITEKHNELEGQFLELKHSLKIYGLKFPENLEKHLSSNMKLVTDIKRRL